MKTPSGIVPCTSTTMLTELASSSESARWTEFVAVCAFVAMSLLGWWAYDVFGPKFPTELKLAGRSVVRSDFVRLEPGKTYRIVGPGLLDAHITGPDSSRLWLTNCALLNRASCEGARRQPQFDPFSPPNTLRELMRVLNLEDDDDK